MNLVTNSGLEQTDLGGLLRDYRLPPEVLPLAPERTPFSQFSRESLATAGRMALRYSEKRGILSHAVRHILGERPASAGISAHTIEAHIDGLDLPQPVADELLTLGFEPDGFARFVPAHYDAHYTFKVKTALGDSSRRAISAGHRGGASLIPHAAPHRTMARCSITRNIWSSPAD